MVSSLKNNENVLRNNIIKALPKEALKSISLEGSFLKITLKKFTGSHDIFFIDLLLRRLRKCLLYLIIMEKVPKITKIEIEYEPNNLHDCIFDDKEEGWKRTISLKKQLRLDPEKAILVFNKKIDVLMEEYKSLRQEILQHLNNLDTLLNYGFLAIAGAISAIGFLYKNSLDRGLFHHLLIFSLCLLIPLIIFQINSVRLSKANKIGEIGYYLSFLELEINYAFESLDLADNNTFFGKYELDIWWERYLRTIRGNKNILKSRRKHVEIYDELFITTLFFIVFALFSIIFAWGYIIFLLQNHLPLKDLILEFVGAIIGTIFWVRCTVYSYFKFQDSRNWQKAMSFSDQITRLTDDK